MSDSKARTGGKRPYYPATMASILNVPAFLAPRTIEFGDCLLWTRSYVGASPCASATVADGSRPMRPVRRLLWMVLYGPVPEGRDVITKCGSHRCVEPRHFKLATRKGSCKNASKQGRMHSATRAAAQRRAMDHRKDRLGAAGAAQVRALLSQGVSHEAVAVTMGITVKSVRNIESNRTYPASQTWRSMVDTILAFPETKR